MISCSRRHALAQTMDLKIQFKKCHTCSKIEVRNLNEMVDAAYIVYIHIIYELGGGYYDAL